MRIAGFLTVAIGLAACAAGAEPILDARLQDPAVQQEIDAQLRDSLQSVAGYTVAVQPDLFRIAFEDAECLEFYDELTDATVGTCLLTASGWQMYAVYSVAFSAVGPDEIVLTPLNIVIE